MKTTTTSTNTMKMIIMLVMLLLSTIGISAQTTIEVPGVVATTTVTESQSNTSMNFVSWFMGTKQTPNSNNATDVSSNTKKQMINSGIAPNRLLVKSFLKKASSYTNTLA